MTHTRTLAITLTALAALTQVAYAQGTDYSKVEVKTTKITANFYMLESQGPTGAVGGAMGVLAGPDGILMVDDANRRLFEGNDKLTAILEAARSRFVPIAMTSLATVIGLIPTAMGLEHGTESNQPLALAVVGGLTSSTLLSLFLVPVMFFFFAQEPSQAERSAP